MSPLVVIAGAVLAGIWMGGRLEIEPAVFIALAAFLLLGLWTVRRRATIFMIVLTALFIFVGIFWMGCYDRWAAPVGMMDAGEESALCLGVVQGPVDTNLDSYGRRTQRFILSATALSEGQDSTFGIRGVRGRVAVMLYGSDAPRLASGDLVVLQGALDKIPEDRNPGGFSLKDWWGARSVFWRFVAGSEGGCVRIEKGKGPMTWVSGWRERGAGLVARYVPQPYTGLAQALALGDRSAITHSVKERFSETGTVHVLAISGLHVGILAGMLLFVLRSFIGSIPIRFVLTAFLLLIYIPLSGAAPPVTRAVLLFVLLFLGRIVGRGSHAIHALAVACLVLVAINPHYAELVSFQFSFGAVLAILIIAPRVVARLDPWMGRTAFGRFVVRLFAVGFAAWLGLAPVVLARFHLFTPIALIANLFVLPLLMPILAWVGVFFLIAPLSPVAGAFLGRVISGLFFLLDGMVSFFAEVPWGSFYLPAPPVWVIVLSYMILGAWVFRAVLRGFAIPILIGLLIAGNVWAWSGCVKNFFRFPELVLAFLDVGQGDALVLEAPGGGTVVIDAGRAVPTDYGRRVVAPYLWSRGHAYITGTIMTHTDADHVGGLAAVHRRFASYWALEGPGDMSRAAFTQYVLESERRGVPRMSIYRGDRITDPSGLELTCLHPPEFWTASPVTDNDRSLVFKVRYHQFTALLTGDIEAQGIRALLDSGQDLSAQVLKVPHHGARIPPTLLAELLERVHPEVAIVSVGRRNRYGHPDPVTSEQISRFCPLYRTDRSGALILRTRGQRFQLESALDKNIITL